MVKFYENWYKDLLYNSNEKELLAQKILELHKTQRHASFLEVGMGTSPFFANKLGGFFDEYWIVEKKKSNIFFPDNVRFVHSDFEDFSCKRKFDGILLSHVIYYFSNLNKSIKRSIDLLHENGCAYFVVNGNDSDYGKIKKFFSEITKRPLIFTYDLLKNAIIKNYHVVEIPLPTKVFFDTYEDLFERLRLFFDLFPEEFEENKSSIISWLKKNVAVGEFCMNQKIFIVKRL